MARSVVAVVAGYAVFALSAVLLFRITHRDPHSPAPLVFAVFTIAYGACFGMLSGLVAARIAGRRFVAHAAWVAALIVLGASISIAFRPGEGSLWTQISAIAVMAPMAVLGGYVRSRTVRAGRERQ